MISLSLSLSRARACACKGACTHTRTHLPILWPRTREREGKACCNLTMVICAGEKLRTRARAARQGFNRNFAGKNGTMYGHGVYFAVLASYSAQVARARVQQLLPWPCQRGMARLRVRALRPWLCKRVAKAAAFESREG